MDIFTSEQISTLLRITAREALGTPMNSPEFSSLFAMIGFLSSALETRLDIEEMEL
jgi:hypothetical protein